MPYSALYLVRQLTHVSVSLRVGLVARGVRENLDFSGRRLLDFSRIQRHLVRQWTHICGQSTRSCRTKVLTCPLMQFGPDSSWPGCGCACRCATTGAWFRTAENCGNSAVPFIAGRRHPGHGAEADSYGFTVQ